MPYLYPIGEFTDSVYFDRSHLLFMEETMKVNQNLGNILLAIYLIGVGLIAIVPSLSQLSIVLAIIAIAAGVVMLLGQRGGRFSVSANLGWILLAIWLIIEGILGLNILKINFSGLDIILAILAIAAGVLILLRR
jgi:hypothetical protein